MAKPRVKHMTEAELAAHVVEYLKTYGHEVFQEVEMVNWKRADIVARIQGTRPLWCIETKVTLSWSLMDQVLNRKPYFHRVSIAIPATKDIADSADRFCALLGIGILSVHSDGRVDEIRKPEFRRRVLDKKVELFEEQKDFVAAGTKGTYFTPFKRTVSLLTRHVKRNPGCTIKEAVQDIDHHYSSPASAKGTLIQRIRQGAITGIEIRGSRPMRLYPEE